MNPCVGKLFEHLHTHNTYPIYQHDCNTIRVWQSQKREKELYRIVDTGPTFEVRREECLLMDGKAEEVIRFIDLDLKLLSEHEDYTEKSGESDHFDDWKNDIKKWERSIAQEPRVKKVRRRI